jgi:hypothetical protein
MGRWSFAAALMCLAVGCNVTVEGKVVDGMTGEAIAGRTADTEEGKGMRILFKAVSTDEKGKQSQNVAAGAMCLVKEAAVGEDGSFSVGDVCASASDYTIELSDKNLFLADVAGIEKGYEGGAPLELKVWRAPKGTGVFKLAGTELSRIGSATDLRTDFVFKSEEKVQSPKEFKAVPLIGAGEYLVLSGKASGYSVVPLINSGKRRLGKEANAAKEWVDQAPWAYLGVEFTSDTEIERKTAAFDAAKVIAKAKGKRKANFVGSDAVPAGRYIIMPEGGKRGWIVDFGAAGKNPGE